MDFSILVNYIEYVLIIGGLIALSWFIEKIVKPVPVVGKPASGAQRLASRNEASRPRRRSHRAPRFTSSAPGGPPRKARRSRLSASVAGAPSPRSRSARWKGHTQSTREILGPGRQLDGLDRELEHRGHRFVRYADDCNVYVRSRRAGERVLDSLERFLRRRLRLDVSRDKSVVDRPWRRSFLGYSVTAHGEPRLKVSPQSVKRLKQKLKPLLRAGRGRPLRQVCATLAPLLRGWTAYYRLAEVKIAFERLDQWLRRKLRALLWRVWRRPRTRAKQLIARGIEQARAWVSATNGRGAWWNAKASHMNQAIPTRALRDLGLLSLLDEHRRLACFH